MNKKAFTLIELIAVIVVLSVILIISMPLLLKNNQDSKESEMKSYIQNFEIAAETYMQTYKEKYETFNTAGQTAYISINSLINEGLISTTITNPETNKKEIDSNNYISVLIKSNGTYEYNYLYSPENITENTIIDP